MSTLQDQLSKENSLSPTPPKREGEPTNPLGLSKQGQEGAISYKITPKHKVCTDAFLGTGGCLCTVKNSPDGTKNQSYIWANKAELQYADRVENSEWFSDFKSSVLSKVGPIFTGTTINTTILKNGQKIDIATQGFNRFLKRADGISKSYNALLEEMAIWRHVNGVVYPIIGKRADNKIVTTYRRAIDVLFAPIADEETFELVEIMFFDYSRTVDGATTYYATKHKMVGGRYVKERYRTDAGSDWANDQEVWELYKTDTTDSDRMLVMANVEAGHPTGCYLPEVPSSYDVVRICLLIMNMVSTVLWSQKLDGNALLALWGKFEALNRNIGSHVVLPFTSDGKAAPAPVKVESNPETMRVAIELWDKVHQQLKTAIKQFGVTMTESNTAQAQTAESKGYDYQATNQALRKTIAGILEPIDEWMITQHMYLSTGSTDEWEMERTYPQDFFPSPEESVEELLAVGNDALDKGILDLAEEVYYKILGAIGGDISPDRLDDIKGGIETALKGYQKDGGDD